MPAYENKVSMLQLATTIQLFLKCVYWLVWQTVKPTSVSTHLRKMEVQNQK